MYSLCTLLYSQIHTVTKKKLLYSQIHTATQEETEGKREKERKRDARHEAF
jgi:hypothetical protein